MSLYDYITAAELGCSRLMEICLSSDWLELCRLYIQQLGCMHALKFNFLAELSSAN